MTVRLSLFQSPLAPTKREHARALAASTGASKFQSPLAPTEREHCAAGRHVQAVVGFNPLSLQRSESTYHGRQRRAPETVDQSSLAPTEREHWRHSGSHCYRARFQSSLAPPRREHLACRTIHESDVGFNPLSLQRSESTSGRQARH